MRKGLLTFVHNIALVIGDDTGVEPNPRYSPAALCLKTCLGPFRDFLRWQAIVEYANAVRRREIVLCQNAKFLFPSAGAAEHEQGFAGGFASSESGHALLLKAAHCFLSSRVLSLPSHLAVFV
jgi:hypothetical protein